MSVFRPIPATRDGTSSPVGSRRERNSRDGTVRGGELTGNLHSVETFGTLDGPGIRFVMFFQGCHLRCLYCQNRDTWEVGDGRSVTIDQMMEEIRAVRSFLDRSGGGITASGGDPILQARFVGALFEAAKREGINTALDTSGLTVITPAVERLIEVTDLILLDIKHVDDKRHRELTGRPNRLVLEFARWLDKLGKRTWIRHVVVPGFTTDATSAQMTGEFLSNLSNLERVELLRYHEMGKHKWISLGKRYPLEGTPVPSRAQLEYVQAIFARYGVAAAISG